MILQLTDLSTEPLASQIARQLRDRVVAGELGAAAALPPVHSFARSLRTSADTVARAYGQLAEEGFVTTDGETAQVAIEPPLPETLALRAGPVDAAPGSAERARAGERALEDLALAREIQCRLLPPSVVTARGWSVASRNEAARFVAGDFYDVIRHENGAVDLVIADVSGKGAAAGLIMASVKAVTPFLAERRSPAQVLTELNRRLRRDLGKREFVALCVARFEPESRLVEVANAGIPDPWILDASGGGRALVVDGERLPLGIRSEVRYGRGRDVLGDGESLLMMTDGLAEHPVGDGCLGYGQLAALAASLAPDLEPERWLEALFGAVRRAGGTSPREDDWTALLLRSTGREGR